MTLSWLKDYNLLIFDHLDSTNAEAIRLAKANIDGNFVIVAKEQRAGKGQHGKTWESVSGNLHVSILLQLNLGLNRSKELSFLTALALRKAVLSCARKAKISKFNLHLKWPNDVLVNGKKLAGILLESIHVHGKTWIVIGAGVNTHFLPTLKNFAVTSLLNEGIILRQANDFLHELMLKFHTLYSKWLADDNFDDIKRQWQKHAYRLNQSIVFDDGTQKVSGVFTGIDDEGAICLKLINGVTRSFNSGSMNYIDID